MRRSAAFQLAITLAMCSRLTCLAGPGSHNESAGGFAAQPPSGVSKRTPGGQSPAGSSASVGSGLSAGAKSIEQPKSQPETAPEVEWLDPSVQPRVVMLCIHGLGLQKGTYEAFGKEMCKYGIATYAIDMRGFGEWLKSGRHKLVDFDGSLADIKGMLEKLHQKYPGLPVVILGESMGGAIALRATALYPDMVSGLISSVPSGDRFNEMGQNLKVGLHVVRGGLNKPMDIGTTIVEQATKKEDLRETWESDPLGKMELTPKELMHFSKFMAENFEAAKTIKTAPVLFIQGVSDKLVRPAGTWKLCDSLATPNRQFVLCKKGEHLIFEDAQFSPEDLLFVRTWIDKNVAPLDAQAIASANQEPAVLASIGGGTPPGGQDKLAAVNQQPQVAVQPILPAFNEPPKVAEQPPVKPDSADRPARAADQSGKPAPDAPVQVRKPAGVAASQVASQSAAAGQESISYWIELYRSGKTYRCNNKTQFKSGDAIRFHVLPEASGYAYVIMKESSSGKSALLFPSRDAGMKNFLVAGQDYPLPYQGWLQFDKNPGIEHVSLVFSREKIDAEPTSPTARYVTAYVGPERTGAKDLVPTRMQLSWDDPTPVIIPDDYSQQSKLATKPASSVRLTSSRGEGVLAIDIALAHQ